MDIFMKQWVKESTTDQIASCYFCSNVGVVYSGVKPAEIISVSEENLKQCSALCHSINYRILGKKEDKYKLFVYHPSLLEETLRNRIVLQSLRKLGYPEAFRLEDYVKTLVNRLQSIEEFPHEIGFFLGYPAKDVLSFMGLIQLPLAKTMGWRMYGDTKTSERVYFQVKHAKEEILHYAKQTQSVLS